MAEAGGLPSGTVTFMFTDIEGSTRLLNALGQYRYSELLAEHHEVLTAAFEAHEGRVVDTQGDSFFVAFTTASEAVASAVDVQRDLAAHDWPEGAEVKVRIGLHTGEPRVGHERYVGIGVHRAARVGAAGHGGQVLLSWTTKGLAEEDLPAGVSIRDLGERRLKDIEQPQHLYQLVIEGLESDFGPLKTLDVELRRKRRRMYAGSALIGVVAAAIAIPVFALGQGGSEGGVSVRGNAVAVIDPASNRVTSEISVGARPGAIAFGSGALWVANLDDQSVSRIDPNTSSVVRTLPVGDTPTGLAAGDGSVWVVGSLPTKSAVSVRRIDPAFNSLAARVLRIGNVAPGAAGSAAALGKTVWIAPSSGLLTQLDAKTGRRLRSIDPNTGPVAVALGAGAVWVADREGNTVTRLDPTGLLTPIPVGLGPSSIAVGADGVWVANALGDAVARIDPSSRAVTKTIAVGPAPSGVAVGAGAVWVANSGNGTVTRIDPAGGSPQTIAVGGSPQSIVVAEGRVWVTVDQSPLENVGAPSAGGTLRVSDQGGVDYTDPALAFVPDSWQVLYPACAQLVNYPDEPAPAGSQLKPEVAEALPSRSANGKTYTFTIRKGFRFSPPSNAPVTAQTFKYAIERSLDPTLKSPAQGFMSDVVGAPAYMSGKAQHISGIVVRGNKLAIRLVAPAPDIVTRLGLPFFCAVPVGTPADPNGLRTIPSAGPYYVESYLPKQAVVLKRNPNYRGSRPHRFDQIVVTFGTSARRIDSQIEAGQVDYGLQSIYPADVPKLAARFGPRSAASRKGRQQFFVNPALGTDFLWLNVHRPLFSSTRLRHAVNYAIDRQTLGRIGNAFTGQPEQPTDQYLPPGMPGFKDARIYPSSPDLATARRLAGPTRRGAVLYTCNGSVCAQLAQVVKTDLAAIGITVQVKSFPITELSARLGRKNEPYDLAFAGGWIADYADPDDFLDFLIGHGAGGSFPGLSFDDPGYQRKLKAAARLTGPVRYLTYGKLDADAARTYAPAVAIGNFSSLDFFSKRIGCQVYQPVYGMDLAALCIRKSR